MNLRGWSPVLAIYPVAIAGSLLHCGLSTPPYTWRDVLSNLYFVPIVIAAINLGARSAVAVALASGAVHALMSALGCGDSWIHVCFETVLFVCVGVTAAAVTRMHENLPDHAQALSPGTGRDTPARTFAGVGGGAEPSGVSQVVAGLVHRFRTPVSSIEGAVWLLEDARVPQEKREEFLNIIRKESHHLDRALSDVLDFTQPRKPRFRDVELSPLIDEVIELAGPREHGPFFLFRKEIPPVLPRLRCDREQIRALLLNLALNSIQATPGGGQITIAVRPEGGQMRISVLDHGRGIPPEIAGRIFDPFFTTRESGLGLGLTVARNIALAHGGNIAVEERAGGGACVSVVLPLVPADAHEHGTHIGS